MSDFFQTGVVTTLHRLNRDRDSDDLIEAEASHEDADAEDGQRSV